MRARLINDHLGQVVIIPEEFRFDVKEVILHKVGDAIVMTPKSVTWDCLIKSLNQFSDDFMEKP